jgi:hypothetical protein
MAAKDEDHGDQHVAHAAFKRPDFWPHDPNIWFRKIESKFRICNIRQSSTKYDHLLSALPTDICSINDSLAKIDENADDAYEHTIINICHQTLMCAHGLRLCLTPECFDIMHIFRMTL